MMSTQVAEHARGHVFISYVREDAKHADRLQANLEAAGIRVWRDTEDLWPGQDWKKEIRQAITRNSLVFIACFSVNSQNREVSYQYEELILAAEQMRVRRPGVSWLVPARFDECDVPELDLGAGRTLDSLQRIDLFGKGRDSNLARLVATVLKILGPEGSRVDMHPQKDNQATRPADTLAYTKSMLYAPERQIELEDLVTATTRSTRESLQDEAVFPRKFPAGVSSRDEITRYAVGQIQAYIDVVQPIARLLVAGCTWGRTEHDALWARSLQGVANANQQLDGNTALISIQRYPALYLLYAAGLGAIYRKNFGAFRAITTDAKIRTHEGKYALINKVHPLRIFENLEIAANVLAMEAASDGNTVTDDDLTQMWSGRKGLRFTPVSDHLHDALASLYSDFIIDDDEYTETFDELEVMLGLIAADQKLQSKNSDQYVVGPWYGSFTWRYRWMQDPIEGQISARISERGIGSDIIRAGLFGGSIDRAIQAAKSFSEVAATVRERRH